jgi:hypothetical protein
VGHFEIDLTLRVLRFQLAARFSFAHFPLKKVIEHRPENDDGRQLANVIPGGRYGGSQDICGKFKLDSQR